MCMAFAVMMARLFFSSSSVPAYYAGFLCRKAIRMGALATNVNASRNNTLCYETNASRHRYPINYQHSLYPKSI